MTDPSKAYITDIDLLKELSECDRATPKEIADGYRRENVIRTQLWELANYGLVEKVTHEIYALTAEGRRQVQDGEISFEDLPYRPEWVETDNRITDLTELDAETIKQFNYDFFDDPETTYGLFENSYKRTENRIWNVKDFQLNRVIEEFPTDLPVCQQCSHWVRAISGKHFFPDANHRTAMGSLYALLNLNNIYTPKWPGRHIDRTVLKAKFIREFIVDVRFDNLWKQDELYMVWNRHFREIFYETDIEQDHSVTTNRLRKALKKARNTK